MTVDEAFMLTLSRLSSIGVLNYSKITPQDRSNGELYYLSLIAKELSAFPLTFQPKILASHPRYGELCEKYGEPIIKRAETAGPGNTVNPRSVAARLLRIAFYLPSSADTPNTLKMKVKEVPRSFDTYQVKAIVSRLFSLRPFAFSLIWETDELDPVDKTNTNEDEWDSSEDEGDGFGDDSTGRQGYMDAMAVVDRDIDQKLVKREVELLDSARDIGFWFPDGMTEAKIRVEVHG